MSTDAHKIFQSLPEHLFERTRVLNARPLNPKAEFVLYWMQHAARGHENPALDTAVHMANALNLPVLVYQGLGSHAPYNNDRHHTFIMEGARDAQLELGQRGIAHAFCLLRAPDRPAPLHDLMDRAALVVTEDFPAPPFAAWCRRLAAAAPCALAVVDTACVLPMQMVKGPYARAFQFRKDNWGEFEKRLARGWPDIAPTLAPFDGRLGFDRIELAKADIASLCAMCDIDHTVAAVPHTQGGLRAGYGRWEEFKADGLHDYAKTRNDAVLVSGVSRMSAYIHHGQVSPFRIAREAAASGMAGADKFLDELLIWRELAHNFCFHQHNAETIAALPQWAVDTLEAHREDRRETVFSEETLARAATGDPLWDAAQRSLLIHGELHNNLRMTWGKAILHWTPSPEAALATMIALNHRYALDGSDPNSYGGILWCLGLFDRPFKPPKPVLGTLRPRSTRSHAKRLDLDRYTGHVSQPASGRRARVAVIGAGLSGLIAARTLSDHGHTVRVFEKARGPGGRMATRRVESYAFDHGAQYFTVRDARMKQALASWLQAGIVHPWKGRIRVIRKGQLGKESKSHDRYVGVPGMSSLTRHLATGLDIVFSTRVAPIDQDGQVLQLSDTDGSALGDFDVVISTAPPVQSAELANGLTPLAQKLADIDMAPCWAVMLAFADSLEVDFDGAFIHDSALAWVARNGSKPGRGPGDCWVLHATAEWTTAHLGDEPAEVIRSLAADFFSTVGAQQTAPILAKAHRWLCARARRSLSEGCLWDAKAAIGFCGDWCSGSRVEGTYLSGAAMAGRVLAEINAQK